MKAIFRF